MTLFDHSRREYLQTAAPLAERMRPRTLAEFVGQEHVVGPDSVLARSISAGHVPSMVLWGPPGSGKTTLAQLIAGRIDAHFDRLSAVTSGVADLRRIVSESRDRLGMNGVRSILFIDEIHRFSKSQQDVILPHVEDGSVVLIGATTENPSFEVISPLLSRARVYVLKQLTTEQVSGILDSAMTDADRGLGRLRPSLEGDARTGAGLSHQWGRALGAQHAGSGRPRDAAQCRWRARRHAGDGRGRDTATRLGVRSLRRPALRHHLGVHQVGEGVRTRTRRSTGWLA